MQTRVLIFVQGGVAEATLCAGEEPVDVVVVDYDTDGSSEEELQDVFGKKALVTIGGAVVDSRAEFDRWWTEITKEA